MTDEEFFAELEHVGIAEVGARLASNAYVGGHAALARAWVERHTETFTAEQLLLARRAVDEAHSATRWRSARWQWPRSR